ncbi:MAG: choice-of-anchor tandem repeat GloVer-containing protein [Candidatus Binatus sp.]|jgi:uncharacterized repeat protein (TIGR03803 family)
MKNRFASVIFPVLALFLVSFAIYAPAARAQSWGAAVLHSFEGADGFQPQAGVIQGSDGNFYGTTSGGGPNHHGTVFQLTPAGTLTTLYSFCGQPGCADGADPLAGVIQGSDGNFYGTTYYGGTAGNGTVFKVTPAGTLTILYSFCSVVDPGTGYCVDGEWPYAGLTQGSDGNFYGTTEYGGTINGGVVFKITPSGTLTTLYSFCSVSDPGSDDYCLDGDNLYGGVIQGSDGNFYGTTLWGGTNGRFYGTVFRIASSGTLTTVYSFCNRAGCQDGVRPYPGLIQGNDGSFYGTTLAGGGEGYGTVFKLTPSGTLTTLYSFCSVVDHSTGYCVDGQAANGVIQGRDGNFYGTTEFGGLNGDGSVFRITPSGTLTFLYLFCSVFDPSNDNCLDGNYPYAGVIQASDGNFYGTTDDGGADGNGTVFEVSPSLPTPSATPTATATSTATPTATPTKTPKATPTPGHIKVIPAKLTLEAEPNATASASITIENTGAGQVTVNIGGPKHAPPFSESGGGSQTIGPGDDYQLTIVYSPTSSTTRKEKSDSIRVGATANDPNQKEPIDVKLQGKD